MGVNNRGLALALGFASRPGVTVTHICDVDTRAVAKAIAAVKEKQPSAPQGVGDVRRILDDPAIDILVVATPNHWHAPATILGVTAGKHVYVEKPCSHTAQEGEWAVAAAAPAPRWLQPARSVAVGGRSGRRWTACMPGRSARSGMRGRGIAVAARAWVAVNGWIHPRGSTTNCGRGPHRGGPTWIMSSTTTGTGIGTGAMENSATTACMRSIWHDGAWGSSSRRRVTSSGGHYRFDDDQETPDTHVVAFEFGARAITWEGLSWSPWGPGGSAFGVTFHGDKGTMEIV